MLTAIAALFVPIPAEQDISVFPQPAQIVITGPNHTYPGVSLRTTAGLGDEAKEAMTEFREDGFGKGKGWKIRFEIRPALSNNVEAYKLDVSDGHVKVEGASRHGLFNAVQTLRQLMKRTDRGIQIPSVNITDEPRFHWRGFMLDDSRHFFTPNEVKHFIDLASRFKINTFHWHLNDDGGWRIEIKKYPNLTQQGAFRIPASNKWEWGKIDFPPADSPVPKYGGAMTQEEVRDVVAYAATKHVTIIPEIEMPGHNLAATKSYPWLVCTPTNQEGFFKEAGVVFPNVYCPGKETTFEFLQNVLDEVMAIFPSKTIHIGGDEVDKYLWQRCDDCKKRMADEGLKTPEELQSYFIRRIEKYVNSKGRSIIGWDEILEGGLAPNAKVMSWRGTDGGIKAASAGHDVVMSPTTWCYFDSLNKNLPVEQVYKFDPAPPTMAPEIRAHILGGECCLWAEWVPNAKVAEERLFPRLIPMAQVLWQNQKEPYAKFATRLKAYMPRLAELCPHMHIDDPMSNVTLIAAGEPVSFEVPALPGITLRYTRDGSMPTTTSTRYEGPVTLRSGEKMSAACFDDSEIRSEVTQISVGDIQPVKLGNTLHGLSNSVYSGHFDRVPEFGKLVPESQGLIPAIKAQSASREWYAQMMGGFLHIETEGVYQFKLGSDDGSILWLCGQELVNNDGLHAYTERSGAVKLKPGNYPIKIGYFQGTEAARLTLRFGLIGQTLHEATESELLSL